MLIKAKLLNTCSTQNILWYLLPFSIQESLCFPSPANLGFVKLAPHFNPHFYSAQPGETFYVH